MKIRIITLDKKGNVFKVEKLTKEDVSKIPIIIIKNKKEEKGRG